MERRTSAESSDATVEEGVGSACGGAGLPPVSLIICSRDRPGLLRDTVASVLAGDAVPAELVVVDQSAAPHPELGAVGEERGCIVRYLWTPGARGLSRARNAGIAAARHDLLAIIDDDMFVDPAWFGALVGALLSHARHRVVTGQVRPVGEMRGCGFAPSLKVDETPMVYQGRTLKDVLFTGNMAMYRSVVDDIGPFDERLGAGARFPSSEDNDYGFLLLEAGYHIVYAPEAVVYHRAWRSARAIVPLQWRYGVGQGAFYAKHLGRHTRYALRRLGRDIRHNATMFVLQARRERLTACGRVAYVLGLVVGMVRWLLTQRRTG